MLIVEYPWDLILWRASYFVVGESHNSTSDVNDPRIIQLPSTAVGLARNTLVWRGFQYPSTLFVGKLGLICTVMQVQRFG